MLKFWYSKLVVKTIKQKFAETFTGLPLTHAVLYIGQKKQLENKRKTKTEQRTKEKKSHMLKG